MYDASQNPCLVALVKRAMVSLFGTLLRRRHASYGPVYFTTYSRYSLLLLMCDVLLVVRRNTSVCTAERTSVAQSPTGKFGEIRLTHAARSDNFMVFMFQAGKRVLSWLGDNTGPSYS